MAQKIEIDKLFVKDVFQKWYRIPEYQRPYVWGADQVIELLDDVYRARQSNPESQYFLGSMVLKKSDKQDGTAKYAEYDLLDGQQRLITLLLITAVVRDLTPKSNEPRIKTCRETIFQMANPDDNIPERGRIVFDIRDKVRDFVDTYIKSDAGTQKVDELQQLSQKSDEDISIRNMASAILTIQGFFQNGNSLDEFFPFLRSNVLMIYVAADELEDAFHLFTVMNTRGIKLRNSDILKAENLAKVADATARTKYAKTWESIEEYFAEDFDNFLSHLRTVLVKQKAGYNLLKEYEDNVYAPKEFDRNTKTYTSKPPLLTKGKSTFEFIERYYKHYLGLFDDDNYSLTNSFELYNQLTLMRFGFEADYWIAPLLRFYEKFKTSELLRFLYLLDAKFSSDWIIGFSPTDRIEKTNAIIREIETTTDQNSLFASPAFKVETQDLLRVLSGGIYGRRYGRYILLKIDLAYHGHTTKFSPPETISIEHILPQTPDADSKWASDFTEQDREKWTNRLGNLILLSRRKNTAQSNLDYLQKKEKYFKKNVELFSNSVRIFNTFSTWNLADIKTNHKDTLVKLLSAYGTTMSEDDLKRAVE
ncbi:MAG: DUF262 domain-containing HNH endonuclease family protein [Deltaproteobacteria bacterium]|nr:DUF262 domain-containing HNH endonuclease family protein [Deltaproteobacteria bacterium]